LKNKKLIEFKLLYIDEKLEALADKYDTYWDWEDAGSIVLTPIDEYAGGGKAGELKNVSGNAFYITDTSVENADKDFDSLSDTYFTSKDDFENNLDAIKEFSFNVNVKHQYNIIPAIYEQMAEEGVGNDEGNIQILGFEKFSSYVQILNGIANSDSPNAGLLRRFMSIIVSNGIESMEARHGLCSVATQSLPSSIRGLIENQCSYTLLDVASESIGDTKGPHESHIARIPMKFQRMVTDTVCGGLEGAKKDDCINGGLMLTSVTHDLGDVFSDIETKELLSNIGTFEIFCRLNDPKVSQFFSNLLPFSQPSDLCRFVRKDIDSVRNGTIQLVGKGLSTAAQLKDVAIERPGRIGVVLERACQT
jgi:hypothetical protein